MRVNVYLGRAGALLSAGVSAGPLRSRLSVELQSLQRSHAAAGEYLDTASCPHVRDALDLAVRALAIGPGRLVDRVRAAGSIISGGVSRAEFFDEEDLALFDRILLGFLELDLIDDGTSGAATEVQRALASDIVDLRDGLAGRAMHDLRVSAGLPAPPLE